MAAGFFITGTGTDVGKTVVTAGLARFFSHNGVKCLPVKPIQSGGKVRADGKMDSPDGEVYKFAQAEWHPETQCPYIFEPASSPHLAAELAGTRIDIADVAEKVRGLEKEGFLLVEGAGGILVPINGDSTMLDLMKDLAYPVILVSENKLGTINETLLSINELKRAGLEIAGVLMTAVNQPEPEEFGMAADNIKMIEKFSAVKVLASIPYIFDWDSSNNHCWTELDKYLSDLNIINYTR
ncbi:dethiobiotin synthase [Maridesulfovibrio zosterae]|uniref:dethiobiotin synthase n=1 Tax=Maridesulfovibrio zosterae TaxID=82171 RepID=UPI0004030353|nr:dethiobiotin synthase [Maridesulfovibrio zosterae]